MENKKTFGAYICRRRKELGLTQREFADRLFVTESAVSKWERGMSYPDITLIRDICAILQVSEHELLTASEDVEARTAETLAKKYLTLLLCALLWVSCAYDGADWFPIPTLPAVLFGLTLPWAWVLICRYAPISRWWKGTACLGAACVFLPLVNPVIDRLVRLGGGTVERLHGFWFRPDFTRWAENWYFNENVLLLLWLALAAAAALCALRALLRRREA